MYTLRAILISQTLGKFLAIRMLMIEISSCQGLMDSETSVSLAKDN